MSDPLSIQEIEKNFPLSSLAVEVEKKFQQLQAITAYLVKKYCDGKVEIFPEEMESILVKDSMLSIQTTEEKMTLTTLVDDPINLH